MGRESIPPPLKVEGLIASDTFSRRTATHFMDLDGNLGCKTKCRFGYDGHTEIVFNDLETFYVENFKSRGKLVFVRSFVPLSLAVTCKRCQKKIAQLINEHDKVDSR